MLSHHESKFEQPDQRSPIPGIVACLSSCLLTLMLMHASPAIAAITITGVVNDSNDTGVNQTTSSASASASATPAAATQAPVAIYGGVAGPDCSASAPGSTCNNCDSLTTLGDCNERRISGTINLTISFSSSSAPGLPGASSVANPTTGGAAAAISTVNPPTSQIAQGSPTSVQIPWSAICPLLTSVDGTVQGNGDCNPSLPITGQINVGILGGTDTYFGQGTATDDYATITISVYPSLGNSTNAIVTGTLPATLTYADRCDDNSVLPGMQGICGFSVYPLDGGARIRDVQALNGFPTGTNASFLGARLYYISKTEATTSNPFAEILPKHDHHGPDMVAAAGTGNAQLNPTDVTGLNNGETYYFKLAALDLARNVTFWTQTGASGTSADGDNFCSGASSPNITSNCHIAAPAPVYGVLGKSVNCFIATAAFGSPMAPQVATFREFRNRFLLTSNWGKYLVERYYKYSPKYANIISRNETLRTFARLALWPILAVVSLILKFGFINTLLIFFAAIGVPIALYVLRQNRGERA